jgi:bacterioferritin-associated ferredoxin
VYACICNAFTEKQVSAAIDTGVSSPAGVFRHLGCVPQCGKCVPTVRGMVRNNDVACPSFSPLRNSEGNRLNRTTRSSTFLKREAHGVGKDLSCQLADRGLDPAPDAHQSADCLPGSQVGHVPLDRDLRIDGGVGALFVQVLADEAFVPDQQAGDLSEPVSDGQSLSDVRRRQCEGDDLITQNDMIVDAEIRLLAGEKTPGNIVFALEDLAA